MAVLIAPWPGTRLTGFLARRSDAGGFELTMRVPATEEQPPIWALRLLHQLGRYVFSSGQPLADGHRMDPGGPITGASATPITPACRACP
ncbi:suppressor of fused domain protein [Streptosporangium subroseum]|uniref:suppressor of fused domain protein n=1 Tax=Streptosporangium subroseum TaxID=106412 RepID=UPI00352E3B4A